MEFFEQQPSLVSQRPTGVEYVKTQGEQLPLASGMCDLVVIDNCIDHCENPSLVLGECHRILRDNGHLYLTVNVRSRLGRVIRNTVESVFPIDRGHPYSYDTRGIRRLVSSSGFEEVRWWRQTFADSARSNWEEHHTKAAIKIGTLTIEQLFEGVWRKRRVSGH